MQQLTDLDLLYVPLEDEEFAQDPFPLFDAAREKHPWLAKTSFGYIVIEYKAIRDMIVHEESMKMGHVDIAKAMGAEGQPWGNFIAENIQGQTGETHKRLRSAVSSSFTPGKLKKYRPMMRETAAEILEDWVPKGKFNFEEFVSYFPISVMCKMLGASTDVIPKIRDSLEALGLAFSMDRSLLPLLNDSVRLLEEFARDLVTQRRANPRDPQDPDLLDDLLKTVEQGKMSEEELNSLLIFLFGAGYDTSKNVLTLIMYTLLDRPDVYERCAQDQAYCRKVMNEALRFKSPASSTRRVLREFVFRDVVFPAGTIFMLPWSISGRDTTAVPDPDVFRPDRPEGSPSVAFGSGPHICLGQFIAKAQIEEGLHLIAQRITKPRLAGPFSWRPFPGVWGLRGLPIEFEPALAEA